MPEVNLLEETLNALLLHGKEPRDVLRVEHLVGYTGWKEFYDLALETNYNPEVSNIREDIVIICNNFRLERAKDLSGYAYWRGVPTYDKTKRKAPLKYLIS